VLAPDMLAVRSDSARLMSSDTLAIAGVAKNEFAAIPMRRPTGHRAGDVAGICHFPCPTLRVEFCPSS
jgi:hypothetical protein